MSEGRLTAQVDAAEYAELLNELDRLRERVKVQGGMLAEIKAALDDRVAMIGVSLCKEVFRRAEGREWPGTGANPWRRRP